MKMPTTEEEEEKEKKAARKQQQYTIECCVVRTTIMWINVSPAPAYTIKKTKTHSWYIRLSHFSSRTAYKLTLTTPPIWKAFLYVYPIDFWMSAFFVVVVHFFQFIQHIFSDICFCMHCIWFTGMKFKQFCWNLLAFFFLFFSSPIRLCASFDKIRNANR